MSESNGGAMKYTMPQGVQFVNMNLLHRKILEKIEPALTKTAEDAVELHKMTEPERNAKMRDLARDYIFNIHGFFAGEVSGFSLSRESVQASLIEHVHSMRPRLLYGLNNSRKKMIHELIYQLEIAEVSNGD